MSLHPEPLAPFAISVCGIEELCDFSARQVSHVLSILDPAAASLPVFGSFGEHERTELRFDDVIEPSAEHVVPRQSHVEDILAFGRDLMTAPAEEAHLLVHCHMGISRSSAAMSLILAQALPERTAGEVLGEVLRIRAKAWPNLRLIEMGDRLLGRGGSLIDAAAEIYALQLERRPQLEPYFRQHNRGREIELARAAATRPRTLAP